MTSKWAAEVSWFSNREYWFRKGLELVQFCDRDYSTSGHGTGTTRHSIEGSKQVPEPHAQLGAHFPSFIKWVGNASRGWGWPGWCLHVLHFSHPDRGPYQVFVRLLELLRHSKSLVISTENPTLTVQCLDFVFGVWCLVIFFDRISRLLPKNIQCPLRDIIKFWKFRISSHHERNWRLIRFFLKFILNLIDLTPSVDGLCSSITSVEIYFLSNKIIKCFFFDSYTSGGLLASFVIGEVEQTKQIKKIWKKNLCAMGPWL